MINSLIETANKCDIKISKIQAEKFDIYYEMLIDWNKKINLTAITNKQDVIEKHFIDSIIFLNDMNIKKNASLIDVGTGAGFPSVPIKIMRPDIQITLLDSLNKRLLFLDELCSKLEIDAKIIHMRAEDAGRNNSLRENYDYAVSRAVANLGVLSEYCLPLVKRGGYFAAFKGPNVDVELESSEKAIITLGGKTKNIIKRNLPDGSIRNLLLVDKIEKTPKKYPRNSGIIKKSPL